MTSAPEVKGRAGMAPRCWACLKRSPPALLSTVFLQDDWESSRKWRHLCELSTLSEASGLALSVRVCHLRQVPLKCVCSRFFSPPSLKYFHILVFFCLSSLTTFREKQKQALFVPSSLEAAAVAIKVLTWLLHYESAMGPRVLERPREVSKFEGHLFTGVDLEDSWRRRQAASVEPDCRRLQSTCQSRKVCPTPGSCLKCCLRLKICAFCTFHYGKQYRVSSKN